MDYIRKIIPCYSSAKNIQEYSVLESTGPSDAVTENRFNNLQLQHQQDIQQYQDLIVKLVWKNNKNRDDIDILEQEIQKLKSIHKALLTQIKRDNVDMRKLQKLLKGDVTYSPTYVHEEDELVRENLPKNRRRMSM